MLENGINDLCKKNQQEISYLRTILFCLFENGLCMEIEEITDILIGVRNYHILKQNLEELYTYASLKHLSKNLILDKIDYLINMRYIYVNDASDNISSNVIVLSKKGFDLLITNELKTDDLTKTSSLSKTNESNEFDSTLFEILKTTRLNIAKNEFKSAFQICHDKVLKEIVKQTPSDIKSLSLMKGIGPYFLENYAFFFLDKITKYKQTTKVLRNDVEIIENKGMAWIKEMSYFELVEISLFESIDHTKRKLLLSKYPNSKDALDKKSNILNKYVWAFQPSDVPIGFSYPFHFEIYQNIYNEINENNATVLYWYFLYFYDSFRIRDYNFSGFLAWYEGVQNGYYLNLEGAFYIDVDEINNQVNTMKSFFDSHPYVWHDNCFTRFEEYVESHYARLTTYCNEGSKVLNRRFMNNDIEFVNLVPSAFYLEAFFKQGKFQNFLEFFNANKELLSQVNLRDIN